MAKFDSESARAAGLKSRKKGSLKTYTMESLIENSGFKSKMTFYRSFNKYTNTTH